MSSSIYSIRGMIRLTKTLFYTAGTALSLIYFFYQVLKNIQKNGYHYLTTPLKYDDRMFLLGSTAFFLMFFYFMVTENHSIHFTPNVLKIRTFLFNKVYEYPYADIHNITVYGITEFNAFSKKRSKKIIITQMVDGLAKEKTFFLENFDQEDLHLLDKKLRDYDIVHYVSKNTFL